MNKTYRLVWNLKHFCWQVVSEIAKGGVAGRQSTIKDQNKISANVAVKIMTLFAVNVLSASVAFAGPMGGVVSSGTATIATSGVTTTINQSTAKAAIDWSSFSTNNNEIVNFVQPSTNSITLNRVTGASASTLNGQLNANGQVFIINPNGVLFGNTSQVNTAGLIASTLNLSNTDFNNNQFNFNNTNNNKTVENRGKITVPSGGTVALIAPSIKHSGTITAPQGNVLFAAGGDITLNLNNGSLLGYTINQGKAQALINSGGMIQADGGKVVLTAKGVDALSNAVVNSVGVIQAQTVNNIRGVIELGSDLESGTLNVGGTLDASAPNIGNGGQIKTSAADVHISSGTTITTQRNVTSSLPPTTSGWELKAKNVDVDFFGGTVSSTTLSEALKKGNVTLTAVGTGVGQGNININDATSWDTNTALSLNAKKDINFNSDLALSGDKAKLAMNYGLGSDYNINNGAKINITGLSPTLLINGTEYTVINSLGEEGDASTKTLQGMQNNLSGNYALGSDIDASETVSWNNGQGFEPIGQVSLPSNLSVESIIQQVNLHQPNIFTGKFHGLGHVIDGLSIKGESSEVGLLSLSNDKMVKPQGLFGITYLSDLRDAGLTNSTIYGNSYIGGLVGITVDSDIKNIFSTGNVNGIGFVGGLAGLAFSTGAQKISYSHSSANVKGQTVVGGLIGASFSSIFDSYATGDISLIDMTMTPNQEQNLDVNYPYGLFAGGLVGYGLGIYNSYATGNILAGAYVNGNWHPEVGFMGAGGLAGLLIFQENNLNFVDHSYATGSVHGLGILGGLAGGTMESTLGVRPYVINNSYATGNVIAVNPLSEISIRIGGLIGVNGFNNIINNSYSTGVVKGYSQVGGLVGYNYEGTVNNSYSTSTVEGTTSIGGLIGENEGVLQQSYSTGSVAGTNNIGGLVGLNTGNSSSVLDSYWNTETSGQLTSAGGTGKTTAELKKIMTFSGWDIANLSDPTSASTWVIDENNSTPWLRYNH